MDPITGLLIGAIGLALAATATVVFWHRILEWGEKNVFPWFERHLPTIAPYVRKAFSRIDNVVTSVRRTVKEAWNKVSQYLLKQVVELNRQTSNTWVQQVTSWVIENSGYNNKPPVKEIRTEQEVSWDDLPEDVRKTFLRQQQSSFQKDVTEIRKQEMVLAS
ncbi:hypothetical protein F7734_05935 [Scytonema sp. UIC 10036]|uniref:hypothetical protein n=1 Tax=Scytonema sp. UIC 10036 TaxID=2304196 RepID=UPI0012DA61F9|nr:hypothetical protein [Scytonema sp. UIC 10036]MUG92024.1 hypothetical protein [Scytonema sp. UIC 10036]